MKIEITLNDYRTPAGNPSRRELQAFQKRLSDKGIGYSVTHVGAPKETVGVHVNRKSDLEKIIKLI